MVPQFFLLLVVSKLIYREGKWVNGLTNKGSANAKSYLKKLLYGIPLGGRVRTVEKQRMGAGGGEVWLGQGRGQSHDVILGASCRVLSPQQLEFCIVKVSPPSLPTPTD